METRAVGVFPRRSNLGDRWEGGLSVCGVILLEPLFGGATITEESSGNGTSQDWDPSGSLRTPGRLLQGQRSQKARAVGEL